MPSLADLVSAAKQDLPVTMRHERWLIDGSKVTPQAAHFAQQALNGQVGSSRARAPMFRASGVGSCPRKQIFSRAGVARRETIDGKTANVFLTGNFIHLKWQVAGLSAGWIKQAEVPVDRHDLGYGGTLDGVLDDDTGLEIKSINTRGFSMVMDRRKPTDVDVRRPVGVVPVATRHQPGVGLEEAGGRQCRCRAGLGRAWNGNRRGHAVG